MNTQHHAYRNIRVWTWTATPAAAAAILLSCWGAAPQAPAQQLAPADGGPAPSDDGAEVLTRGPVHEAFAEVISYNPQAGVIVPQAPPAPIEELPPDQKPEGDNVQWIPGYWTWDDERQDYLWLSGVWRAIPPGRKWVSGYWREVTGGHQWVAGYWADAAAQQVEYLPQPPATLDVGPNVAAPSANHTWIPGTWVWRQTRYAWRPGYWIVAQPNWVWVPAYYVWAPGGFIFAGGYWDYVPMSRGVLFAPVYFTAGVYSRPGFFYSPSTVISLSVFGNHLFCRPQFNHYYFGDYYAANYVSLGFYPWFSYASYRGYDPFWAHQRWSHRNDRDWVRHVQADYRHRRDHKDARPPHTWSDVKRLAATKDVALDNNRLVATSFAEFTKSKEAPVRFQSLDKATRQQFADREKELDQFRQQRKQLEAATNVRATRRPTKVNLPKTPIAAVATPADVGQEAEVKPPGGTSEGVPSFRTRGARAADTAGQGPTNRRGPRQPNAAQTLPNIQQPSGETPSATRDAIRKQIQSRSGTLPEGATPKVNTPSTADVPLEQAVPGTTDQGSTPTRRSRQLNVQQQQQLQQKLQQLQQQRQQGNLSPQATGQPGAAAPSANQSNATGQQGLSRGSRRSSGQTQPADPQGTGQPQFKRSSPRPSEDPSAALRRFKSQVTPNSTGPNAASGDNPSARRFTRKPEQGSSSGGETNSSPRRRKPSEAPKEESKDDKENG
jgi:hypothetical protein